MLISGDEIRIAGRQLNRELFYIFPLLIYYTKQRTTVYMIIDSEWLDQAISFF